MSRKESGGGRGRGSRNGAWRSPSLVQSFRNAWNGFTWIWHTEANMRLHFAAATLVLAIAWWLEAAPWQWAILVLVSGLVILLEWVNTAIEGAVDLATNDHRPQAGRVKDVAAGAVLVAAAVAAATGVIVLGPELPRLPGVVLAVAERTPWRLAPLALVLYFVASSVAVRRTAARP
ncbi:MAG: diacylglycerol kinase [Bacillota bacterium]|nr:MAG: diacylglycerol kinase [Bacillota bacterium]